jgi:2-dehydro-3-deoxygalactonokinase
LQGLAWIAVDWGTSNLRVWAMSSDARILGEASSDRGMSKLDQAGFEPALLDLIADWLPTEGETPVMACGMVGARQGWIEAPYRLVPCQPVAVDDICRPDSSDPRLGVMIIPGLKQIAPPDVMRGEETQIAGLLLDDPTFDGVLCMPGTHTKWVQLHAGKIVEFRTFMTGEIYGLLADMSVLRHSLGGNEWDAAEFSASVRSAVADPNALAKRLFSIRSEMLVADLTPSLARGRLSGLLIGAELAAAQAWWAGSDVVIVGNGAQAMLYADALRLLGREARFVDTTKITLAGLQSAWQQLVRTIQ